MQLISPESEEKMTTGMPLNRPPQFEAQHFKHAATCQTGSFVNVAH